MQADSTSAAVARARQAFGVDWYSEAVDPDGMAEIRRLCLDLHQAGHTAVVVRCRPWQSNERPNGEPWASDVLTDDAVLVRVRYRIGQLGDPVERDLPITEIWRLARMPEAELIDVLGATEPGAWSFAIADDEIEGVRCFVQVEDGRGLDERPTCRCSATS